MIDLARKNNSPTLDMPVGASSVAAASYPTFYFNAPCDCDIPDEGTAIIKFRKIEESENTRDKNDPQFRYELEVQGIEIKDGKGNGDDGMDMGKVMRKAVRQKMMDKMGSEDDGDE